MVRTALVIFGLFEMCVKDFASEGLLACFALYGYCMYMDMGYGWLGLRLRFRSEWGRVHRRVGSLYFGV